LLASHSLLIMIQFTSFIIQFIFTMIQFITHYDPIHYPLSSNSLLTTIQSPDTVPTLIPFTDSILKYSTKNKTKCEVFLVTRHVLQLHMKGLPRAVGTERAGSSALVCTAVWGCVYRARVRTWRVLIPRQWKWALWLVQRADWKAKSLGFLWDVLSSSESRGVGSGTYSLVQWTSCVGGLALWWSNQVTNTH
jgi:hypothetical protein